VTNEELVMLIKAGDDGYLPQLWEQVRKFIAMQAKRYYFKCEKRNGIEIEDLVQSGYFAVLKAVRYYEPEKGYKMLALLDKTLINSFRETMGIRTSKRDALNFSTSLDEPAGEDGTLTALDLLGDLTPEDESVEDNVIESVYHQELHHALDNALSLLSDKKQELIKLHYYFGLSFEYLAKKRGVTKQLIWADIQGSFIRIMKSSHRSKLKAFLESDTEASAYTGTGFRSWKYSWGSSVERVVNYRTKQ